MPKGEPRKPETKYTLLAKIVKSNSEFYSREDIKAIICERYCPRGKCIFSGTDEDGACAQIDIIWELLQSNEP